MALTRDNSTVRRAKIISTMNALWYKDVTINFSPLHKTHALEMCYEIVEGLSTLP